MAEWWQDEQFWRDVGPYLFNAHVLSNAESEVEDILDSVDVPDNAMILDVGSGIGRLTFPLLKLGHQVVGVEICNDFRRRARTRAAQLGLKLDIRHQGIIELSESFQPEFDLVLSVFSGIGYFADPVCDMLAVKSMISALKPGGTLYIQTRHPKVTSGRISHSSQVGTCVETRRYARETGVMTTTWSVTEGARSRVHRSSVRVYSKSDLRGLLEFCGMQDVVVYDELTRECLVATGVSSSED